MTGCKYKATRLSNDEVVATVVDRERMGITHRTNVET